MSRRRYLPLLRLLLRGGKFAGCVHAGCRVHPSLHGWQGQGQGQVRGQGWRQTGLGQGLVLLWWAGARGKHSRGIC